MAFVDTPLAAEAKSTSQPLIRENFQDIATFTAQDHETFGTGADLGKHKQITLTLSADDPATLVNEMAIYNKGNALFIQPQNKVAGTDGIDFTTATKAANGYCVLPSGIKINWGVVTINAGAAAGALKAFVSAFTTTCYVCNFSTLISTAGHDGDDLLIYPAGLNKDGFTPTRARNVYVTAPVQASYIAIGD